MEGMPPLWVYRATDGELIIFDGVTRATRAAKYCGDALVPVIVVGELPILGSRLPKVEEKLP